MPLADITARSRVIPLACWTTALMAEGGATKLSEAELCHNAKSIRYVLEGGLFGITNLNSSDP